MRADACPSVSRSVNPAASAACSSTIEALLLEGELVHAIAAVNAGTSQHVPVERVRTGADGRFEFTPLPRGQYVLVLNLDDRPESTEFDRRAYHPGTRVPGEAAIVTVDGPTIVDAGTFRVPSSPVERTITGVVVWSDGSPGFRRRAGSARRGAGESAARRRRPLPRDACLRCALYPPRRRAPRSERPRAREL